MLSLKHVVKRYPSNPKPTLVDISYDFPSRGLYYLVGKSGAGKSTLLALLGGMDADYLGDILYQGKSLKSLSPSELEDYRLSAISFAFQDYKTDDKETVHQTLMKTLLIVRIGKEAAEKRITEVLREVGLSSKRHLTFSKLSGGEKKRIALARSLLKKTPVLFADEPLSGLNPGLRKEITHLLEKEAMDRLVIVITHEKDEIPPQSNVLLLEMGKLTELSHQETDCPDKPSEAVVRRLFTGTNLLRSLCLAICHKSEFLVVTLLSLAMALFSIAFSLLLSYGVRSTIQESLSDVMTGNCMVVQSKETGYVQDLDWDASYGLLSSLAGQYPSDIIAVTSQYLEDIDTVLDPSSRLSLCLENQSLTLEKLTPDSFLRAGLLKETGSEAIVSYDPVSCNDTGTIILGLDKADMASLYYLLYERACPEITETILDKMLKDVKTASLALRLQFSKASWDYSLDHSLSVSGLILSDHDFLCHPDPDFRETFVREVMHFETYDRDEEIPSSKPWGLHRSYGLSCYPERIGEAVVDLLKEKQMDPYCLIPLKEQGYYFEDIPWTHNRFLVRSRLFPSISYSEMEDYRVKQNGRVKSIRYSTPVFSFAANGFIAGFTKPFFFSRYRNRLNQIQDENQRSKVNLGQFQATAFDLPEGVFKADLLSSSKEDGLHYQTLEGNDDALLYGKSPKGYQSIGISSALASGIFGQPEKAIGESLSVLVLEKTTPLNGEYLNTFREGSLRISSVYDNEKPVLYQDSFFPLGFAYETLSPDVTDFTLSQAIVDVDLTVAGPQVYQKTMESLGDYKASFPMLTMLQEIDAMMKKLSLLFTVFSVLSLILSAMLLGLSLYLILVKDRKTIGILLTLGYRKKEIARFYRLFGYVMVAIGYLLSLLLTRLSETVLSKTLSESVSLYNGSLFPYLFSFGVAFLLAFVMGQGLSYRIRLMDPLDVFHDK